MPTQKKRINVTLPDHVAVFLEEIALRDDVPQATKAADLIALALEVEEDDVWNTLAEKRDTKDAKFISHDTAWA